jgi:hypothetical protein
MEDLKWMFTYGLDESFRKFKKQDITAIVS